MNKETDLEIIEKAKLGDQKAIVELIKRYEKTIFNFAFKICRDKDKAENTMQETFINILKSLHQFDGNSKFSTWIYRIVLNNCLMESRENSKTKDQLSLEDEDITIEEPSNNRWYELPMENLLNNELKSLLDAAIKKLEPLYREVFILRDIEGLSIEETGQVLNLTVPTIKTRLHRARLFLRNELKHYFENR